MTTDTAPTQRYVLDGSDDDLRRLLAIADVSTEMARRAFRRIDIQPGWRAIDCGCGPIGALALLAELVGPSGRVVGADFNGEAIERARGVADSLGLANVEVVRSEVGDLDVTALGGPFDLAYTRCFLMHQPNPSETLRHIVSLLRPGGFIVAQEPLRTPPPRSQPPVDALGTAWDLLYATVEAAGVPSTAIDDLATAAARVGLEAVSALGTFTILDPDVGFDLHASTMAAARDRVTQLGVASGSEVDAFIASLHAARDAHETAWVSTPTYLDLVLRKPD